MSSNNTEIELPQEKLNKFKCVKCENYLSCGPVYMKHSNSGTICGRCRDGWIKASSQNLEYEELAEYFLFPCMYSIKGCPAKIKFSKEKQNPHEMKCYYAKRKCFLSEFEKCNWSGYFEKHLKHWKENHPEQILKNPTYDCSTSFYLFEQFDIPFYINVEVDSDQIMHRIFGKPMKKVEYILKVKRDKVEIINERELNISNELTTSQISFSVKSLKDILGGIDNTKFELEIKNNTSTSFKREIEPSEENEISPSNAKKGYIQKYVW